MNLHTVGNAGFGAFFHTLGAGAGSKAAGYGARILLPKGAPVPGNLPAGSTVLAGIPQAATGDRLTPEELRALASMK